MELWQDKNTVHRIPVKYGKGFVEYGFAFREEVLKGYRYTKRCLNLLLIIEMHIKPSLISIRVTKNREVFEFIFNDVEIKKFFSPLCDCK